VDLDDDEDDLKDSRRPLRDTDEFTQYKNEQDRESELRLVDNGGILKYWQKREQDDKPNLARAAKYLLSIPATQCASERLFSAAGTHYTTQRNRLLPEHMEQEILIKSNQDLFDTILD